MICVFDYRCTVGHVHEVFARRSDTVRCPQCGAPTNRLLAAPASQLEGWSYSFPSRALKWDRDHYNAAPPQYGGKPRKV